MAARARTTPIPSVWARPKPTPNQPALSRALIVREAIAMLDAEGVEALSMRKLGARLNAGATSLYRHVALKDELMELAVDEVLGEVVRPPADGPDWRAAVTRYADSFRATAVRHPWMCAVLGQAGLAYLGPNLAALSERLDAVFTAAGFPEPHGAIDVVYSYAIGMVTSETAWLTTVARSGQSEAEFLARILPGAQVEGGQQDPGGAGPVDPVRIRDERFAYGLDVVLDGLALRLAR
ncbi:TetR/AcrR family transcriptional regulator [Streptomyces sp. NPDC058662]|uniref:TetR/AcrR family transcriptional regulator n=1 Tax=Streptomyces sp. NPDC058662 TaxID=3346583 RepID=UPI003665E2A7